MMTKKIIFIATGNSGKVKARNLKFWERVVPSGCIVFHQIDMAFNTLFRSKDVQEGKLKGMLKLLYL